MPDRREILEELYRRKQTGRLSLESQTKLKSILRPSIPFDEAGPGPSPDAVIQIADVRKHHIPPPGWTEEKIIESPTQYALQKTIHEIAKIPGTAIKEAGQMAVGLVTLPPLAWWEMMSIADRNIQPQKEDITRIAQENKVSPETVIEGFKAYQEEKRKTAPDYMGKTKEVLKDWIKPYTSLENFVEEAPKRPLQIVFDAAIVAGIIKKLAHTGAKFSQIVKALRKKGFTNNEIKIGVKLSANNLKVKKELRESTVGHEEFGKLSPEELMQAKLEKAEPLASELIDNVKTPVQAAIAAHKAGRTKIAKMAADKAIANAKKVEPMDGPTAERFINEQLGQLPASLRPTLRIDSYYVGHMGLPGKEKPMVQVIHKPGQKKQAGSFFYDPAKHNIVNPKDMQAKKTFSADERAAIEARFGKPALGQEAGVVRVGKEPKTEGLFVFPETIEKRYKAAKGINKEGLIARVSETIDSIKNKVIRDVYEYLPRISEYMPLRNDLLRLQKAKGIASHDTVRTLQQITKDLDRPSYDLFTRKVIMDDLLTVAEKQQDLPLGFTPEVLLNESTRLDGLIKKYPKVNEAIQKRTQAWKKLRKEYSSAMKKIGFNVEDRLKNEAYFRHQVLEYININGLFGVGKKLRTPTGRGFLKERHGSTLDINTDYLQAEGEVIAQMLHDIDIAKTIKSVETKYSIHKSIKANYLQRLESLLNEVGYTKGQLLFDMEQNAIPMVAYENTLKKKLKDLGGDDFLAKRGLEDWRQIVKKEYPEYSIWQPREGNVFFMSDSIPAKLAEELTTGALEQVGITAKDLRKMVAMGGRRKEFVIKNEIADTLDNLTIPQSQNVISQLNKKLLKSWKVWTLISPRRYAKYNIRNLTGDADALFVGNPSAFKEVPAAINDLWGHFVKKEHMSPELKGWFSRGGFESTLQAQEIGEVNNLKIFLDLQKPTGTVKDVPLKVWQTYWKKARMSTDFREAILRYAAYRDYLKQMTQSGGVPKNFGASIPDEIMSLSSPATRAYHLSNELLGAYDRISVAGKALREHLVPFWSWKEVNFKRYIRLFKNAASDRQLCEAVGRKAVGSLAKTPYRAYRTGKFLVKATAFWSALQVYNHTVFPEEEKALPEQIRHRPHIIFGRDKNGEIVYFSRIGALGDFLEWFGLDAAPHFVDQWMSGKLSLKETAQEIAKAPVNVVAQSITPVAKIPAEIISRRNFFPDIFRPRTVRNRGYHFAKSLGLENEYREIMNLPTKGYEKSLPEMIVYRLDPLQAAYSDTFDAKQRFLKKIGKFGEGFWLTPRGDALYNFKMAIRYKDEDAAKKYLENYFALGGTEKGLEQSLDTMNPLYGLNETEQFIFITMLSTEEQKKLAMAFKFWNDTLLGEIEGKR